MRSGLFPSQKRELDKAFKKARAFDRFRPRTRRSLIRTVQELLGHEDVATTMIDTHVLNRGPAGVRSPTDRLLED